MDAFDADVLIYAAVPAHALGRRVRALFSDEPAGNTVTRAGVGSLLLLPELLTKPTRDQADSELVALTALLARQSCALSTRQQPNSPSLWAPRTG